MKFNSTPLTITKPQYQERGWVEELVRLGKNILIQICRVKEIPKITASLLQPKGCKNDVPEMIHLHAKERAGGSNGR